MEQRIDLRNIHISEPPENGQQCIVWTGESWRQLTWYDEATGKVAKFYTFTGEPMRKNFEWWFPAPEDPET